MSSIVERLRDQWLVIQHPERKQIADLLEQQAKRIKELEAELDSWKQEFRDAYRRETEMEVKLAALRKCIDDAPVVCVARTRPLQWNESLPSVDVEWKLPVRGSLISKEDLK